MSRSTKQQRLELLVDMFDEDRESDAATVLEKWRDRVDDMEREWNERYKGMISPLVYGFARVEDALQSDASGTFRQVKRMVDKQMVREEHMPDFARFAGLTIEELWSLARGEAPEIKGWKGLYGPGFANAEHRDTSERDAVLAELAREDREDAAHLAKLRDLQRRSKTTPEPTPTPFIPGR